MLAPISNDKKMTRFLTSTAVLVSTVFLVLTACNSDSGTIEQEKIKREIMSLNKKDSLIDSQSRQLFGRLDSAFKLDSNQRIILRLFYDNSRAVFERTQEITTTINTIINKYDSIAMFDTLSANKDAIAIVDRFKKHISVICVYSRHDAQETLDSIVHVTKPTYQILMNAKQNKTKEDFIYNLSKLKVASRQTQKMMIELILANWDSKPAMVIITEEPNGQTDTIHWTKEDYK